MTVQEVFNTIAVKEIETQILDIYYEMENKHRVRDGNNKKAFEDEKTHS